MDISGAVLRRSMICAGVGPQQEARVEPSSFSVVVGSRGRKGHLKRTMAFAGGGVRRFRDEGHLSYYVVPARCGKKEEKKRAKLVKGLSRDLSALRAIGTSFDLPVEVKGNPISETAEILLAQLDHLRCQEKEMKRKKKEAKAAKKEAKMNSCNAMNESSTSSSESSDTECEEVIKMSNLGMRSAPDANFGTFPLTSVESVCSEGDPLLAEEIQQGNQVIIEFEDCRSASTSKSLTEKPMDRINRCNEDETSSSSSESSDSECEEVHDMSKSRCEADSLVTDTLFACEEAPVLSSGADQQTAERLPEDKTMMLVRQRGGTSSTSADSVTAVPMDKIEVCMGGKCKRSGAIELMAEFERRIGMEGAVASCKCMGKCKQGPNVRVSAHCEVNEVSRGKNPLCIGVAMEDVSTIVSNFLGEKKGFGALSAV